MPTCPAGHDSASSDFCDVCGVRIGGSASPAEPAAGPSPAASAAGPSPAASGTGTSGTAASGTGTSGTAASGAAATAGSQPLAAEPAAPCPRCGTASSGRFCESCGYDFESGQAPDSGAAAGGGGPAAAASGAPVAGGTAPGPAPATSGTAPATPGAAPAAGPGWTAIVASYQAYYQTVLAAGGPDAASIQFPAYCPERRFRLAAPQMRIGRRSESRGLEPEIDLTGPPTDPGISRLHAVLLGQPDGSWAILDPGSENGTSVNGSEVATGVPVPLHDGDQIHIGAWTVITIQAGTQP